MNNAVSSEAVVLSELAAVMRAIARRHRSAGAVLRTMASAYEAELARLSPTMASAYEARARQAGR